MAKILFFLASVATVMVLFSRQQVLASSPACYGPGERVSTLMQGLYK
jgi:hypothetical protein